MRTRSRRRHAIALVVFALVAIDGARARADDDLNQLFQAGLVKYKAGAVGEAIRFGETLYARTGPEKGYRVAYNLARAYEQFGDAPNAAAKYEAFLAEVRARRATGRAIEAIVDRESHEAEARLADIIAKNGRLRVVAGAQPVAVVIDSAEPKIAGFTVFVAPGKHVVRFAPGTALAARRDVEIAAGEQIEVAPPEPSAATRVDAEPVAAAPLVAPERPLIAALTTHPFPPVVVYVSGAVTLASAVVPVVAYAHALTLANRHNDSSDAAARYAIEQEYPSAKNTAYATLAIPLGLGLVTGGLTTWYFAKSEHVDAHYAAPFIAPTFRTTRDGAVVGAIARF